MKVIVINKNKNGEIIGLASLMEESQVTRINKAFTKRNPLTVITDEDIEKYPAELFVNIKKVVKEKPIIKSK